MTNVLEKIDYRKEVENFQITDVVVIDEEIQVIGEGELYAVVNRGDVLSHHPGADGATADRNCDRATHYHIPAFELWDNGTDQGDPATMVCEVFDEVEKEWKDEDDVTVMKEYPFLGGKVKVFEGNGSAVNSWDGQESNDKFCQNLIDHGFWIEDVSEDEVECFVIGSSEMFIQDAPKINKIQQKGSWVRVKFKREKQ